ncbi:MAG: DUF2232 domain-containing protein [Desulfarculus sp.]|nr:DUF2232 domain-containing protein [Desulfarculus sp.]
MIPPSAGPWLAPLGAAVASLLLFLAPWFIPILGALWVAWTPLPLLLAYRQRGLTTGRVALGLALAMALPLGLFFGGRIGGVYFLFYAAMVLVLGEAPRHRVDEAKAMGLAALAGTAVGLVLMTASGMLGGEAQTLWQTAWQRELDAFLAASRQAGVDNEGLRELRGALAQTGRLVMRLAPGLLCAGSLLLAWANLLMVRVLAKRLAPQGPPPEPLNRWQAPEHLVWLVIASGVAIAATEGWPAWAGVNLLLPLGVVYFFQGMAVLAFWLEKKNAPRLLRVGLYALLAVEVFLALLVALAGLFDLWFNFRRLGSKQSA